MQQFLRIFLDIVLWQRGPQDLPASPLLVWITLAAYVAVSAVQLALLDESGPVWFVFLVMDPALLVATVWLMLRLYGRAGRFQQTASAVLGTGALLGVVLYLPLQVLMTASGMEPSAIVARVAGVFLVVVFALVTGRILKLATESSLFVGIAASLTYFLAVNELVGMAQGAGN